MSIVSMTYLSCSALILLYIVCHTNAQQLLPLNKFSPLFAEQVDGYQRGAALYVSSNDNDEYLKNIKITNGAESYTASSLSQSRNVDGSKIPKILNSASIQIKNTNNDSVTENLSGSIYITTALQANDASFIVFDVTEKNNIDRTAFQQSNLVFMNVNLRNRQASGDVRMPSMNSYVSNVKHALTSTLTMFHDVPAANYKTEKNINRMFTNPIDSGSGMKEMLYFTNIEPMQICSPIWYLTINGTISLTVEGKFVDQFNYTTTAPTTTGLVMAELTSFATDINFLATPGMNATSGVWINYMLFEPMNVTITDSLSLITDGLDTRNSYNVNQFMSPSFPMTRISIRSLNYFVGNYYIQYYKQERKANPTTPGSPTTTQNPNNAATVTSSRPTISTTSIQTSTTQNPNNGATVTSSRPTISTTSIQTSTRSASSVTAFFTFSTLLISYIL